MTQTNMNEDCNLDTIKVSITDLAELRDLFEFDDDMSEAISSPEYVIPFVSKKILELQAHVNQLREAFNQILLEVYKDQSDLNTIRKVIEISKEALSATTNQSLIEHGNEVIERRG